MQINSVNAPTELNLPLKQTAENFAAAKPAKPEAEKKETAKENPPKVEKSEELNKLKTALADHDISLRFSQDEETKQLVVNLVNNQTGESILQLPSEVSLRLAANFVKLQGQFVDEVK